MDDIRDFDAEMDEMLDRAQRDLGDTSDIDMELEREFEERDRQSMERQQRQQENR